MNDHAQIIQSTEKLALSLQELVTYLQKETIWCDGEVLKKFHEWINILAEILEEAKKDEQKV